MNGATIEPSAKIIKPPRITITKIIGNNQNFFLFLRNRISSIKNSTGNLNLKLPFILIFVIIFFYVLEVCGAFVSFQLKFVSSECSHNSSKRNEEK